MQLLSYAIPNFRDIRVLLALEKVPVYINGCLGSDYGFAVLSGLGVTGVGLQRGKSGGLAGVARGWRSTNFDTLPI